MIDNVMNISLSAVAELALEEQIEENEFGEAALPFAPTVCSDSGHSVVPQQYLRVSRSLTSVEAILSKVSVPDNYLLFAGEENGVVYLLCAVIGHENYVKRPSQREQQKIVYGRRWTLDPSTPTSEVVQTALIAVKKAREHELRERVHYFLDIGCGHQAKKTTPFNCHLDLPLMASSACQTSGDDGSWNALQELQRLEVDGAKPELRNAQDVGLGRTLFDVTLEREGKPNGGFPEFEQATVTFLCERNSKAEFLHGFFNSLLALSDRFVESALRFDGFARFERSLCPSTLAEFSYHTRNIVVQDARFDAEFQDMSYRIDSSKAPAINGGQLGEIQHKTLALIERQYGELAGYLPHGYK